MRSLSEFMNSNLSQYIYTNGKSFLPISNFEIAKNQTIIDCNHPKVVLSFDEGVKGVDFALWNHFQENENWLVLNFDKEEAIPLKTNKIEFLADSSSDPITKGIIPVELIKKLAKQNEINQKKILDLEISSTQANTMKEEKLRNLDILDEEEDESEYELFVEQNGFFKFNTQEFNWKRQLTDFGQVVPEAIKSKIREFNHVHQYSTEEDLNKEILKKSREIDFYSKCLGDQLPNPAQLKSQSLTCSYVSLSDGYSMEIILRHLRGNKIVLINGNEEEDMRLYESALKPRIFLTKEGILKEKIHETRIKAVITEVSEDVDMKHLKSNDIEYTAVSGVLETRFATKGSRIGELSKLTIKAAEENRNQAKMHSYEKFRLNDFRNYLRENGISSNLESGQLNIENKVYVRQKKGRIMIEGIFSTEYYEVRKRLYEHMHNEE